MQDFFTPIGNTKPYLKAAFEGFAGSGKTYTAAMVAIGLHQRLGSTKPIVIFDTEQASKFLKPFFADANIAVLVRESRSMADLKRTMEYMRSGESDILIIDSLSHVWEDFIESYKRKVNRISLQMLDWGVIKPAWKAEFATPFVQDPYHIIMNGRAGYEYEQQTNEQGKKEIVKSGIKMKVEGETAYEPDLIVLMERFEEMTGNSIEKIYRQAKIIKDRSTLLDGKVFENPTYQSFAPTIDAMLSNPIPRDAFMAPEGDTGVLFKTEEDRQQWKRDKEKAIEELDGLLNRVCPGATGKDRTMRLEILDAIFNTTSWTAIGEMNIAELRSGYRAAMDLAVTKGLAHYITIDDKPKFTVGAAPTALTPKEEGVIDEQAAKIVEPKPAATPSPVKPRKTAKAA